MKVKIFSLVFFSILFITCKSDEKNLSALDIVENSIEKHGGIKKWKIKKTLSFNKKTVLYTKNGQIEKTINQYQFFEFSPTLRGKIVSENGDGILFNGTEFRKISKDSIFKIKEERELEKVKNQFYAAEYVVCQPFKLNDENITLLKKGIEEINNVKTYAIGVNYKNDTNVSDKWIYYFDVNTFQLVANKVIHIDRESIIENLTFDTTTDFIFNKERKSFITENGSKKKYLRAEYFYNNFKITF